MCSHSVCPNFTSIVLWCGIDPQLTAALVTRWLGEPVRSAVLPTSIWLSNKKGFPVLSRGHQQLVKSLVKLHTQFIITGPLRHQHYKFYQQYLEYITRVGINVPPDVSGYHFFFIFLFWKFL